MRHVVLTAHIDHTVAIGVVVAIFPTIATAFGARFKIGVVQVISGRTIITKAFVELVLGVSVVFGAVLRGQHIDPVSFAHKVGCEIIIGALRKIHRAHQEFLHQLSVVAAVGVGIDVRR